jgi:translation initiation factor 2 alpha subunit (eIF-2alpha)
MAVIYFNFIKMNIQTLHVGDSVNVTINSIDEMGILVTLDDYHCEGFVPLSEISNKRISFNDIIKKYKIGGQYVAKIIRMDTTRGYFDLSFKTSNNPVLTMSVQSLF